MLVSASWLVEHLGEPDAAGRLMQAIEAVTASGVHTPDLGGKLTTQQMGDAVVARLQ